MANQAITEKDIDALENDLKSLKPQVSQIETDVTKLATIRDQKKKELKEHLQAVRDMGEDPDDIENTVRRYHEVAKIKQDNLREEIKTARAIVDPLLKDIE